MTGKMFILVILICWFPYICHSTNGCSVTNICDSTQSECRTSENAALGKMAEISTLLRNSSFGDSAPACVVVNGNRNNWFSGSGNADNCAHTNETDYTGWWQVHLGRNYTIQNISIYSQNTGDRLSEVRITIDGQVCYDFPSIITGVSIINVTCNTPLTGSTVRLEKRKRAASNTYYLVLCEVEIWVCRPGLYGQSCDNKCNCTNNDTCNNYNGTCPNDLSTEYTEYACEGSLLSFTCPQNYVIQIISFNYGRLSADICVNQWSNNNLQCRSAPSKAIVSSRCNGLPQCDIPVSKTLFGDPCYGTSKYAEVQYVCKRPGTVEFTKLACEDSVLSFSCPTNQVIKIVDFNYGRLSPAVCVNRWSNNNLNCKAPWAKDIVSTRCNGRYSCEFLVNNAIFGDPCYGTSKYGEVVYNCE